VASGAGSSGVASGAGSFGMGSALVLGVASTLSHGRAGFGWASGLSHGGFRMLLDLLLLLHGDFGHDDFLFMDLGHFLGGGAAAASGVGAASALASGVGAASALASGVGTASALASGGSSGAASSGVASGVLLGAHGSLLDSSHGRSGLSHGASGLLLDHLLVVFVIGVVIITLDG